MNTVGGLCGINSGTISKCYTKGSINATAIVKGTEWGCRMGGICGWNEKGNIVLSYNKASIKMTSDIQDPGVGGICGYTLGGEISNCYNRGSLSLDYEYMYPGSCLQLGGILSFVNRYVKDISLLHDW